MWLEYIRERMPNKSVLEIEGAGFAVYYPFPAENSMYLEEIFVKKAIRKSSIATEMLKTIEKEAKASDFKYIMGSCDPTTAGATVSMKAMLASGFEIYNVEKGLIFLRKEIE